MRPDARAVARDALLRIDQGAYANLLLPRMLERSGLSERDRRFATELVYGTTRMRRAGDFLVDRFVLRPLDAPTRAVLRLGAFQLHHLGTPAHAAVSASVAVAPPRARGLVNAVLRRVGGRGGGPHGYGRARVGGGGRRAASPVAGGVARPGAGRRPLLGPGCAAAPARRPLAGRARRRRSPVGAPTGAARR